MAHVLQHTITRLRQCPRQIRVVLLVFFAILLTVQVGRQFKRNAADWAEAKLLQTTRHVVEHGLLQPQILAEVRSETEGTLAFIIDEGMLVAKDALLFRIDEDELIEAITELENSQKEQQVDVDVAAKEYEAEKKKYDSRLAREAAELSFAQTEERYKLIALQPGDREIQQVNIRIAELDCLDAEAEFKRMQNMVQRNFAAASQLEPLERRVDSARTYVSELKLNLAISEKGISDEERIALRAAVEQAQSTVNRSRQELEQTLKTQETRMDIAQTRLRHTVEELVKKRKQLNHSEVHAPLAGVVRLRRTVTWSSGQWKTISTGKDIDYKDILADLVSPHEMRIEIMVHESDVTNLSTGIPVQVQLAAYPAQVFPGQLIHLSSQGQDRSELSPIGHELPPSEQSLFKGIVTFEANGTAIQPGMSARVTLQAEPASARLVIPRTSVFYIEHQPHVWMKNKRTPHLVQGNMLDAQWFHVTAGLEVADKIQRVGAAR